MTTEAERRKQVIALRRTDIERWRDPGQLEAAWNQRAQVAADLIPAGATVLDLGCGSMALERYLPPACTYLPCDVIARDQRTLVHDFNAGEFPMTDEATHITVLGVVEYLYDVPAFLRHLGACARPVVLSYNPADLAPHLDRAALGWVNHLRLSELEQALGEAGLAVRTRVRIDANQVLLGLAPGRPPALPRCRILVVSTCGLNNFGDRLGFHLINELLPAHATVHHASVNFQNRCHIEQVPAGDFDLLIVGIGHSLFGPMLSDELMGLLDRAPRAIGIFGTQYRQELDRGRLEAILDRLETWYARSEEDILWYGRGRRNVVHLGDWLISAFPLGQWNNPANLIVDAGIWRDLPLDRAIQRIQAHRSVCSGRLHPLLCALTSAERVAYREQRETGSTLVSGKFRSLFIDVFGRSYPEEQLFEVDRDAVALYKDKVQRGMAALRQALRRIIGQ
jgi:hypothetical protein